MGKKLDGQMSLAVACLQMDMRDVMRRVKALEADWFVLELGMAISAGIMVGYLISWLLAR